ALREQTSPTAPLPVELAVITHWDRVAGMAKLLEELKEANAAQLAPLITMKSVWFNHFLPEDMEKTPKRSAAAAMSPKDQIPRLPSELGIAVNDPFDYFVMASERGSTRVTLAEGIDVTVMAPDGDFLQKWYSYRLEQSNLVKSGIDWLAEAV